MAGTLESRWCLRGWRSQLTLVVHLIDFHHRNPWVENQFDFFRDAGIEQGLISFSERGRIHDYLESRGSKNIEHFDHGLFGFLNACITLKKWAQSQNTMVYAHGHIPAIFASFIRTFTGVRFVICHHQPSPKLFTQLRKRIFLRAIVHSILAKFYYMRASIIQVLSLEIQDVLLERGLSRGKIVRIPLGLDFKNFYSLNNERGILSSSDELVLVSISRLAWEKRIDLGIRTVAHLINQGFKMRYLVVGAGPELDSLKSLASDLKVSDYVDFLGHREDINIILNRADILFHLSITEAYGQVIMEARLTDLPIFTSACGVALDMEEGGDSIVEIFRSENSPQVARELKEFVLNLQSLPNVRFKYSGREIYKMHDYQIVIPEVVRMFISHFDSKNHIKG